jgi:hypothetical protein
MGFWFAYTSLVLTLAIVFIMPKRITRKEIYATWGWMAALTLNTDIVFGLIFDLYDFVTPSVNLHDIILQATLPPSVGIIIINFFPNATNRFLYYLFGTVLFALFYEWASIKTGYLVYKGWSFWYSIPIYIFGVLYLRWHIKYLRSSSKER